MRIIANLLAVLAVGLAAASCGSREASAQAGADTVRVDTVHAVVMQVQRCSRLYTTEYRMHKVITHDDRLAVKGRLLGSDYDIPLPLGKRKVAIPIDATAKAYIDFAGFGKDNVVRSDSSHINIILPEPRIVLTSSRISHDDIREYVALTRGRFSDEELASYEQQGRKAVMEALAETDILENARAGAANVLVPMLVQMGYRAENVTVSFGRNYRPGDIMKLIDSSTVEKKSNARQ